MFLACMCVCVGNARAREPVLLSVSARTFGRPREAVVMFIALANWFVTVIGSLAPVDRNYLSVPPFKALRVSLKLSGVVNTENVGWSELTFLRRLEGDHTVWRQIVYRGVALAGVCV